MGRRSHKLPPARVKFASIFKLPDEIMGSVFENLKVVTSSTVRVSDEPEEDMALKFLKSWVSVTHVCSRWRKAAIEQATLWTPIVTKHPEWTREMLTRSKGAPIAVTASSSVDPAAILSILAHMHHISDLYVTGDNSFVSEIAHGLGSPAPLLNHLTLMTYSSPTSEFLLSLPNSFLSGHAPQLRSLQLSMGNETWKLPRFPSLTSLTISVPPTEHHSWIDVLKALESSPALEMLYIYQCLPMTTRGTCLEHPRNSRILLNRLSSLTIMDVDAYACALFANLVEYPKKTGPKLGCKITSPSTNHELELVLTHVGQHCETSIHALQELHKLTLDLWDPSRLHIVGHLEGAPFHVNQLDVGFDGIVGGHVTGLIKTLCDTLPLKAIQVLEILHSMDRSRMPVDDWSALKGLTACRELIISSIHAVTIAVALLARNEYVTKSTEGGPNHLPSLEFNLPALQVLEVKFVELYDEPKRSLYQVLEDRTRKLGRLRQLSLTNCEDQTSEFLSLEVDLRTVAVCFMQTKPGDRLGW